jgi:hypothetical protein
MRNVRKRHFAPKEHDIGSYIGHLNGVHGVSNQLLE